jgi:hypothetical protein
MAGYFGKPVMQKLGVKPGFRIFVDGGRTADGQPSWRGTKATKPS